MQGPTIAAPPATPATPPPPAHVAAPPPPASPPSPPQCTPPLAQCGGQCMDILNSAINCGACGRACPNAGRCVAGTCIDKADKTYIVSQIFLPTKSWDPWEIDI